MDIEELFFDDEPLPTTKTSVTLDVVTEDKQLEGKRGWGQQVVEGGISFNPEACRIVFIEPDEHFSSPLTIIDRAKWDVYLVTIPFTLKETPGEKFYKEMKFSIELVGRMIQALDLFPNNITTPIAASKTYDLSPRIKLTFEGLHPTITALGEGHNAFYWIYEGNESRKAVPYGTKRVAVLLRVPRGTQLVQGRIAYDFVLERKRGSLWQPKPAKVEPYSIQWNLTEAQPLPMADTSRNTTAVILTTQAVEYEAVRTHLTELREKVHERGTVYEQGVFSGGCLPWKVIIAEASADSASMAFEAERVVALFKPSLIFLVGTAGGIKDVHPGDVVAATKICGYESGKAERRAFKLRPVVFNSSYRLEQRVRAESRKKDWLQRLEKDLSGLPPKIHIGPIASGDKEVASADASTWSFLRAHYNDALAVEIGDHAFLDAIHANHEVEALVIRGISHRIEDENKEGEAERQKMTAVAAHHASAFVFEIIAKFGCGARVERR